MSEEQPEVRLDVPHMQLLWQRGELVSGEPFWWRPSSRGGEPEILLDEPVHIGAGAGAQAQLEATTQQSTEQEDQHDAFATKVGSRKNA